MKVVIFAGGLGTRISEESHLKPKPMIEIGGKPILWHIMKIYSAAGFNEFIICLGYKGYLIKEYFLNYFIHNCDLTVNLANNEVQIHTPFSEPFKVTMVETGLHTKTAGRLRAIESYIDGEDFMLTYGDGVADIDIRQLYDFHRQHQKICTMTAIIPEGRFGTMEIGDDNVVQRFREKPQEDNHWVNGGFFVLNRRVFSYLNGDMSNVMWEAEPLQQLTDDRQLVTYKHSGFWMCMDTVRDRAVLEKMWENGEAEWKLW